MKLRSLSIYFVFNVLSALMPIVTLPLFTRYMSPQDYGTWTVFSLMAIYASMISRWEINNALKLHFVNSEKDFSLYASTAFFFACGWFTLFVVFWLLTLPWNSGWNGVPAEWFLAVGLLAFFRYQTINLHQLLQIENRSLLYGIWSFLANIGLYGVAILLLMFADMDWRARAWAELLIAAVSFAFVLKFWRRDYGLRWRFDKRALYEMLIFTSPLMVSSVISYLLTTVDRLFVAQMLGAEQLGLYTIAVQLSASMGLFMTAVTPAWEAALYKYDGSLVMHVRKRLTVFALVVLMVAIVLLVLPVLLQWVLPILTDKSFNSARNYLFPTLLVAAFSGLFALLQPVMVLLNRTRTFALLNIAMFVAACASMWLCIPIFGGRGAAYALAATYLAGCLVLVFFIVKWTNHVAYQ